WVQCEPFYVALRAQALIFAYVMWQRPLTRRRPSTILAFTDGNPHGLAAMALGLRAEIPTIFASHGALSSTPAPLHCSLALLYGEAAFQQYQVAGSQIEKVLYYGFKDQFLSISDFKRQGSR